MTHSLRSLLLSAFLFWTASPVNAAQIVGGEVEVIVHSAFQFFAAGIGLAEIPPAGFGAPPTAIFPIVGGDTDTGIVELGGGVIFSNGLSTLAVTNFVINLGALTTTVDTSINGESIETVLRSNNFNCAAMMDTCFAADGITAINDANYSGSFFSQDAMDKFDEAFPGNTIDFSMMLADVSRVTALQTIPLPGMAVFFGLATLLALRQRRRGR